jgi:hypothetical protein
MWWLLLLVAVCTVLWVVLYALLAAVISALGSRGNSGA